MIDEQSVEILKQKMANVLKQHHPLLSLRKFLGEINYRFGLSSLLWIYPGDSDQEGVLIHNHRNQPNDVCDLDRVNFAADDFVGALSDPRPEVLVISDLSRIKSSIIVRSLPEPVDVFRSGLILRLGLGQGQVGILCPLKPEQLHQITVLSEVLDQLKSAFEKLFNTFGIIEVLCGREVIWSNTMIAGRTIVPGQACGQVVYLNRFTDLDQYQIEPCTDPHIERERLHTALARLESVFDKAVRQADTPLDDVGFVYELFLHVLSDQSFRAELNQLIDDGYTAKSAAVLLARRYQDSFNQIGDEYLRERRHDFIYLAHRLIGTLEDGEWHRKEDYGDSAIVLAGDEIGVPDIMMIPADKLVAIIAHRGSALAHVSILARAKSIPVVADIIPFHLIHLNNRMVQVDANKGRVLAEPGAEILRFKNHKNLDEDSARSPAGPAGVVCSSDGVPISCYANLGLLEESRSLDRSRISGVGLFRSEIYFHSQLGFPSLEAQTRYYRRLLSGFHPAPVWMRLLDIGRDKNLPYFSTEYTKRDWCGARILIDNPDVMRTQIEAMLRANHNLGNLRILVPNVTHTEEIIIIRRTLDKLYQNLLRQLPGLIRPEFGAMVEIPGLIFLIDSLAQYVDYISIGSNDLLRNLLLADREDQATMEYHSFLSPAVLRALSMIMSIAQDKQLRVGICGEAITGNRELMMCLGVGLRHLSVGGASVPQARLRIAGLNVSRCQHLFKRAAELPTTAAVEDLLAFEGLAKTVRLA